MYICLYIDVYIYICICVYIAVQHMYIIYLLNSRFRKAKNTHLCPTNVKTFFQQVTVDRDPRPTLRLLS